MTLLFFSRIGHNFSKNPLEANVSRGGELVKFPGLLDLNLRKGSAIYFSYNVCNGENIELGVFTTKYLLG